MNGQHASKELAVRCCYCGRTFVPDVGAKHVLMRNPGITEQEANEVSALMISMLAEGAPLECGSCR